MAISKVISSKKTVVIPPMPKQGKASSKPEKVAETPVKKTVVASTLSANLFDNTGKVTGTIALPESVFGQKINKTLLKQAVHIYLTNQRQGTVSTKSRGEVDLTKAKWYRQKGTGRARHGAKSAPIFVKGGLAHGPKPREFELSLSKIMKQKALLSALSSKCKDQTISVIDGMDKLPAKTKNYAALLTSMEMKGSKLILLPEHNDEIIRSLRNIEKVLYKTVSEITTYDVLAGKQLIIVKEALAGLEKRLGGLDK